MGTLRFCEHGVLDEHDDPVFRGVAHTGSEAIEHSLRCSKRNWIDPGRNLHSISGRDLRRNTAEEAMGRRIHDHIVRSHSSRSGDRHALASAHW